MGSLATGGEPARILIPVSVSGSPSSEPDRVTVSGGGSLGIVNTTVPVHYGTGPAPVGFANADTWISNQDGTIDTQAGSHPYELTLAFATNSIGVGHAEEQPNGDPRALDVNLPPGLVGEPGAVPKCTREEFDGETCSPNTRIGENFASVSGAGLLSQQVYNLVPPPGIAAQFAFTFNDISIFLDARVRSGGDYGITEHANIPAAQDRVQHDNDLGCTRRTRNGRWRQTVVDTTDIVWATARVQYRRARYVARRKPKTTPDQLPMAQQSR